MTETQLAQSPILERIRSLLSAETMPVHLVGGTIRDALLGRPIHDIDLIVPVDAISLTFRLANVLGLPAYVLDDKRDVGRIMVPGNGLTIDIARYRDQTLENDLRGRDFTINAMALPIDAQTTDAVIDLHHGLDHLRARRIHIIHPQSIDDDPVRALRAVRFASHLGFTLSDETSAAARAAGVLLPGHSSAERIRDELNRILSSRAPNIGIEMLHALGLLEIVLPDIARLDGLTQSLPHFEDVYRHTLRVLHYLAAIIPLIGGTPAVADWEVDIAQLLSPYREDLQSHLARETNGGTSGTLLLMWGGLLHDIGKQPTQTVEPDGRIRFFGHDEVGAELAAKLLSSYSFSNESTKRVRTIVAGHMRPLFLANENHPPSRRSVYRYFRNLHEAGLDVALLSFADHLATHDGPGDRTTWESLLTVISGLFDVYFHQYEVAVAPPRLLDGKAIMTILDKPPGHEIGRLLRLLEEAQATGEVTSHEEAITFIRQQALEG